MEWKQDLIFLTESQQVLCLLLSKMLFGCEIELKKQIQTIQKIEWPAVWEESEVQAVVLPAFSEYQNLPYCISKRQYAL